MVTSRNHHSKHNTLSKRTNKNRAEFIICCSVRCKNSCIWKPISLEFFLPVPCIFILDGGRESNRFHLTQLYCLLHFPVCQYLTEKPPASPSVWMNVTQSSVCTWVRREHCSSLGRGYHLRNNEKHRCHTESSQQPGGGIPYLPEILRRTFLIWCMDEVDLTYCNF